MGQFLEGVSERPSQETLSVEELLERSEKEVNDLRQALDQSSIVAFTDSKGTITYVNDKFCEISKFSREELIGQNHRIINSTHHPKQFFVDLWKSIASGKVWTGEIKNRAKDGSYYWVFTTIVPFLTPAGRPFKYVAIRTDITARKQEHEQAEQHRAALMQSEKMASVGELAAGIAHELGNPLAMIAGRVEFLEMQLSAGKASPEDTNRTLATIRQLTERMASIIRGMRALSRDGAKDSFQMAPVCQILKDVLEFTRESFQKHGIRVEIAEIDPGLRIWCQETQISQVFVNLINNAKDAVLPLADRWIRVEALDRGELAEIAITDSGAGIAPELRAKIMQPFFTTKAAGKGTGLGLSVSTNIVERHGGSIRIDADCPNTRFIVSLPKEEPKSG